MRDAPGVASSAAETNPPAAVSATEMVSLRERRSEATSSAACFNAGGGNVVVEAMLLMSLLGCDVDGGAVRTCRLVVWGRMRVAVRLRPRMGLLRGVLVIQDVEIKSLGGSTSIYGYGFAGRMFRSMSSSLSVTMVFS